MHPRRGRGKRTHICGTGRPGARGGYARGHVHARSRFHGQPGIDQGPRVPPSPDMMVFASFFSQ